MLQLCFYTEQLARIQGRRPELMHVVNGLGERETFRPGDYEAYYRRLQRRFLAAVASGLDTYPLPVEHCGLCDFLERCQAQWEADDHLVLVAGASRLQVERLENADIRTLTALAEAPPDLEVPQHAAGDLRAAPEPGRAPAPLPPHRRAADRSTLPLEDDRGFALLPEPSPGDIWLDFEGDPWFEPGRGLEFLTGWLELAEDGEPVYRSLRAATREEERAAFEAFVDHVVERRRRFPGMHVYHYAPYERTALTRLMGEHATREEEIDDLLRGEVLVDLYRITRQALRASVPSYSLKEVEKLFGFERTAEVGGGSKAVHDFETYLETGEESLLEGIEAYNREDCVATYELHRWLLERRPEIPWRPPPDERERSEEAEERDAETRARPRRAPRGRGGGRAALAPRAAPRLPPPRGEAAVVGVLLPPRAARRGGVRHEPEHARRARARRRAGAGEALVVVPVHVRGAGAQDLRDGRRPDARSGASTSASTTSTGRSRSAGARSRRTSRSRPRSSRRGRSTRRRRRRRSCGWPKNQEQYPAALAILERRPPRASLGGSLADAALSLDESYLFVQGPPGSGKTWNGARVAVALMRAGQRVGVTALSHKAIHKFLDDLEEAAGEAGFEFRGMKKGAGEGHYENRFVECTNSNDAMLDPELQLLAGTSWLFARGHMDQHVDTLFVDEGGQFALADALAVATRRGTSSSSATRTSCRRSRRARIRRARRSRCSATCSARMRRCGRGWASSSSARGGCGRR